MSRLKAFSVRACALVVLSVLIVAQTGCGNKKEPLTPGADILTQPQLQAKVAKLGYPVYWLGPRENTEYEYTHRADGRVYIRYVKPGTTAGSYTRFLTVGTYPMPDAYEVVKKVSKLPDAREIDVKGGIIGAQSEKKPQSVYAAFRGKDLELEVYSPDEGAAVQEVQDGNLQTVPTG